MLDIKFIRQNPEKVKEGVRKKGYDVNVDLLLSMDKKKRDLISQLEKIFAQKNQASKKISLLKNEEEKKKIILEMKELDKNSDKLKNELKEIEAKFKELMLQLPNLPFDHVPIGKDEKDNVVLKKVGKLPKFNFKIKDYLEIAEELDLIDIQRAAKISGSRFGFLKNELVLMEFALVNFVFENLLKYNFIPVIPPVMLKEEMARGTGYFEATDKSEAYFIPADNLYLIGTSEQSLIAMHANEIFEEKDLPKRYLAFSTCFRREAGSYGKDTRGILRVHQFDKIEMVIFCKPEDSKKEHQLLLELEEKLMKLLKIPYQVVQICTGDLGRPAAEKYDIEAWMPSESRYRETHSNSNCTDFQSRRLNIRYRQKSGKLEFVHTLNGTALAIGRTLIMLLENYQQKDGSVKIPKVLEKYLHFKIIKKRRI